MSLVTALFRRHFVRATGSSFVRNVLLVMSGTALAQAVAFALSPVISRLFSPADFGAYGAFNSLAGIIAAGVTLEYSQSIMLPKQKEEALQLLIVSCLSTLTIGFLCLTVCVLAPGMMQGLMKTSGQWVLLLLVAVTVVNGLNVTLQAWCVRIKAFKTTSASQVVRGVSSSTMQIGFGLCKLGAPGLILGSVLADVLASLNLLRAAFPDLRALPTLFRWERLLHLAREYRDFPVYSASVRVINSLSLGLPVLLLAHYYGIATAGAYAFALRILQTPANLVLGALHQVLFQKACEIHQQGRSLKTLYIQTTLGLFALAALPFVLLLVWATPLFTWLFGAAWALAGELARWIALWLLFAFCNLPATLFARILRVQRKLFLFNILLLAARTLALVLGGLYLSASQTVCLFSAVGGIMNIGLILIIGAVVVRSPGVEPDSRQPDVSSVDRV